MSKNDVENKLSTLKGNYSLILFSEGIVLDTYIILANNIKGYSIFILKDNDIYGTEYDIPLKIALNKFNNLIK